MTKKEELIRELESNFFDHTVIFVEKLDTGQTNHRKMIATRIQIINLLKEWFDDELHGHFKDEVYTTILNATYEKPE